MHFEKQKKRILLIASIIRAISVVDTVINQSMHRTSWHSSYYCYYWYLHYSLSFASNPMSSWS